MWLSCYAFFAVGDTSPLAAPRNVHSAAAGLADFAFPLLLHEVTNQSNLF